MTTCSTVSPAAIQTDGLQLRAATDRSYVDELAALFDEESPTWPDNLPPIVVFADGQTYWLADGHHRLAAAVEAGCREIRVEIRKGTKRDAILYACSANANHGLRRTNADKRNAIRAAYQLDPKNSERGIAKLCRVSRTLVAEVLAETNKPSGLKSHPPQTATESESGLKSHPPESAPINTEAVKPPPVQMSGAIPPKPTPADRRMGFDELGFPIATELASDAFLACVEFDTIEYLLREAARKITSLAKMAGAELYRANHLKVGIEKFTSPDLENAIRELKHWRPYAAICPHCEGEPKTACKVCLGLPYLTKSAWERVPEAKRQAILDARKGGYDGNS